MGKPKEKETMAIITVLPISDCLLLRHAAKETLHCVSVTI